MSVVWNAATVLSAVVMTMIPGMGQRVPDGRSIDAEVQKVMAETHAKGMAVAVIDRGKVKYVQAYGVRDAKGDPLKTDTLMYGASETKAVFAYTMMTLVDAGKLKLDVPIKDDLAQPLASYDTDKAFEAKYGPYKSLVDDARWEKITPRICLTHSAGFSNFWFMEPDYREHIHFEPGTRFSYSGEGLVLLQFAVEHGKAPLGMDLGTLTDGVFAKLGMTKTSLIVRPDYATNPDGWANGFDDKGEAHAPNVSKRVRAAGSMTTTIDDFSKFVAALVSGNGLSKAAHREMLKPTVHITTAHEFPVLQPDLPMSEQRKDLYMGLGVEVFDGPQGHGFLKAGHDEQTGNTMVCVERSEKCAVILSNDVRAEKGFAELVKFILGDTDVPYDWEYGDYAGKSE